MSRYYLRYRFLDSMINYVVAATILLMLGGTPGNANTAELPLEGVRVQTLEAMAGQMILVGFRGTGEIIDDNFRILLEDIDAGRIGSVILFERDSLLRLHGRNIVSLPQVRHLVSILQSHATIPLLVGVDQEGGRVTRLKPHHGAVTTPSAEEMGRMRLDETRAYGRAVGTMLRSLGISVNFAPSLDVDRNETSPAIGALGRSFSSVPDTVAEHGLAFAQGQSMAGIIGTYKHFPGHGSAAQDTHTGLTDITTSWDESELKPFKAGIANNIPMMVMTGHVLHKEFDAVHPASLSYAITTGLLRDKLGWQGVIITDDLFMRSIADYYSLEETIEYAVNAGADILLLGNNLRYDPLLGRKAHACLVSLVKEGKIPLKRIQESYDRIMLLKQTAGILDTSHTSISTSAGFPPPPRH